MNQKTSVTDLVHEFVLNLLPGNLSEDMSFHNPKHTQELVRAAIEISGEYRCTPMQLEIVIPADWFHDCGYIKAYINPEDFSKALAEDFLEKHNYSGEGISQILARIEATRFPYMEKMSYKSLKN